LNGVAKRGPLNRFQQESTTLHSILNYRL